MMRSKEDSMDYRYFPEPDLPALDIRDDIANLTSLKLIVPSQEIKIMTDAGFNKEYINALISEDVILTYYKSVINHGIQPLIAAKWMT
jgi:aspartyl-tRNA(Asn)/glutamyl-tRNA(Gln) amidotransferase subunit B